MPKKPAQPSNIREPPTFDSEALSILAYEFSAEDHAESERKIKRRLRDKKLGPFDLERVARLRALKDDLQAELGARDRSKFYASAGGPFSDMADWRMGELSRHLASRHRGLTRESIDRFLPFAIYLYYLR